MRIAIGSDHGGLEMKQYLVAELKKAGHDIIDCGAHVNESVDYPDYAGIVAGHITSGSASAGIVICGTGIGISIAANKIHGIRAALCHTEYCARMARQHNDANILALGGRVLGNDLALSIATVFINESFSHGERHSRRVEKIRALES